MAKKVRQKIIETISKKPLLKSDDIDYKWPCATLVDCHFHLNNSHEGNIFERLFLNSTSIQWERGSYYERKPKI